MQRINLSKYGFVRHPELDFSDDGSRFQIFKVGDVKVSKLVADGYVYISGKASDVVPGTPHAIYSKIPEYRDLDALNGVPLEEVTEDKIRKLYQDCIAYEANLKKAVSELNLPTRAELEQHLKEYNDIIQEQIDSIKAQVGDQWFEVFASFTKDSYELRETIDYMKSLQRSKLNLQYLDKIEGKPESVAFMQRRAEKNNFYYREIMSVLNKYIRRKVDFDL